MDSRMTHAAVEVAAEPLSDAALGSLREAFRGELIRAMDPGYEEARRVWNGAVDRHPAIVARCTGTADVAAVVRFARAHRLEIAVRGGGHSVAGHGTVNGHDRSSRSFGDVNSRRCVTGLRTFGR